MSQSHIGPQTAVEVKDSDWYAERHDQLVKGAASTNQWLEAIHRVLVEMLGRLEK